MAMLNNQRVYKWGPHENNRFPRISMDFRQKEDMYCNRNGANQAMKKFLELKQIPSGYLT
jgi:hypothetical protein